MQGIRMLASKLSASVAMFMKLSSKWMELSTEISVDEFLCTVEYDYPAFHLKMNCYLCSLLTETLHLNEHEAAKWLSINNLDSVKWLPADVKVLEVIKTIML